MRLNKNLGNATIVGLVVVVAVLLVSTGVLNTSRKSAVSTAKAIEPSLEDDTSASGGTSTPSTPSTTTSTPPAVVPKLPVGTSKYMSGVYTAVGSYTSPGGVETIDVTVTLEADKIVNATVIPNADRPESKKFQDAFVKGFKTVVIGKNIDSVILSKVSGSSLTPKGFNDAVAKIKVEAKA